MMTEDMVRDRARDILGLFDTEEARSGVGQITTFNQLGFPGISDKPDGWHLPQRTSEVAIILETKAEGTDIGAQKCIDELQKNCAIAMSRYDRVIGLLYNGAETRAFKNGRPIDVPDELQSKDFYVRKFMDDSIDKELIYTLTARINNCLHSAFGIKDLYHRMIFTACALVADRDNRNALMPGMDYATFHRSILSTLSRSLEVPRRENQKLDLLLEVYSDIKINSTENQAAIDDFIGWVKAISASINSTHWRGEDVMGIFFNEFNRYKKKSESGQVFTPDHITSFMYRLLGCGMDDCILDACCGSGAFLVKAMSNMIEEAGGVDTSKAADIQTKCLFGIEFDRELFALACANMLIHKDGKTNLAQMDSRTEMAREWIRSKPITKVLMNPPYENKYGCITIVENVLDSVRAGTPCAFILPDKKLEKVSQAVVRRILRRHRLTKIIKLPEALFFGQGVTTSIFVFEAGVPQNDTEIFGCWIEDDGLETVKNQGRHDVRGRWPAIEDYWAEAIYKRHDARYHTDQWIKPSEHLSYQMPERPFEVCGEDFRKAAMDWLMFKRGIDVKDFGERLSRMMMYGSGPAGDGTGISFELKGAGVAGQIEMSDWQTFSLSGEGGLFTIVKGTRLTRADMRGGDIDYIGASATNNGITNQIANDEHLHPANTITVSYNGSVGEAFYQDRQFWASDDVNVLYPRFELSRDIALFFIPLIRRAGEKYRFVDKWKLEDMCRTRIPLPVTPTGDPDLRYMETYMQEVVRRAESDLQRLSWLVEGSSADER